MYIAALPDRAVLEVSGADRVSFLQGLVSNDVAEAVPGRAVWAALLTPQGKWLADFFILADGDRLLLDCEAAQADMLMQKLTRFRLRAAVQVQPVPLLVHAAWGSDPGAALQARDLRVPDAGWRVLSDAPLTVTASFEDWDRRRLALGLPDGSRDMESEKTTLLEAGFDELHGVSWTKGCYMGQELTARTKYRGLLKRRLMPVRVEAGAGWRVDLEHLVALQRRLELAQRCLGAFPDHLRRGVLEVPLGHGGTEVGTMRSGRDELGLALLRLDALGVPLTCGQATLHPAPAPWMALEPIRLAQQTT